MKKPLVSIVIPTKNSESFLTRCLSSIRKQSYQPIEILLVDGHSTDKTITIGKAFNARVLSYEPNIPAGLFDAPYRRNYGGSKANGNYIYYVDADMELTTDVVGAAVDICEEYADAVIIPEDSFGEGIWAQAKQLERRCYWGDDTVEAPRFISAKVWRKIGGLDVSLGGGGDDWDLAMKLREAGYRTARIHPVVLHYEGRLTLAKLFRKRYMYGRDSVLYIKKRPKAAFISYFPIRASYLRNWKQFAIHPFITAAFIVMRTVEYVGGFLGILHSRINRL